MAFIYDLSDTWNAGGTTFNAIKMNVTDSASAAASKLVTLQVGGSERFGVRKDGQGYFAGNLGIGTSSPTERLVADGRLRSSVSGGTIDLWHDGTNGSIASSTQLLMYAGGSNSAIFHTNAVERMRIDSSGNVGIGTSAPGQKLTVAATTNQLSLTTGTNELIARASSSEVALYTFQALPMSFYTNNTERMRIDSSGNVGIGTTPSGDRVNVAGNIQATQATYGYFGITSGAVQGQFAANSGGASLEIRAVSNHLISFFTNNTERMRIDNGGNVGIGTSGPDAAARLDVSSTTSGFLPPRMTTAQRDAISSPPNGLMLYNTTTDKLQVRAAGSWVDLH